MARAKASAAVGASGPCAWRLPFLLRASLSLGSALLLFLFDASAEHFGDRPSVGQRGPTSL